MSTQPTPQGAAILLFGGEGLRPEMTGVWREALGDHAPGQVEAVLIPAGLAGDKASKQEYRIGVALGFLDALGVKAQAVSLTSVEDATDPALLATLSRAGLFYLPGGSVSSLVTLLNAGRAWAAILARALQGVPLVVSGGACVALGEVAFSPVRSAVPDPETLAFSAFRGLGLIPGCLLLPYFDQLAPAVLDHLRSVIPPGPLTMVGVPGLAALCWLDQAGPGWQVRGEASVVVMREQEEWTFAPGDTLPSVLVPAPLL
ncbi:MAG: hypothetical protein IT326_00715 [Anaerolineae bacterium]|nr:hypothetical protein [Anaerolineae bacterium]